MKQFFRREDGMMMVEGMLALLATIMVLICLLGFGFLFYQQWAVCNIANDTATRIAQTYAYTDTDPVMGYINESQIRRKPLLRYYRFGQIEKRNADRGEKYARWSLKTSSLASASSAPEIQVETKHDALACWSFSASPAPSPTMAWERRSAWTPRTTSTPWTPIRL